MSEISPILSLPYLQPSQAQKHVTHNEALQLLDVLVQTVVADRNQTTPPVSPATGQGHIVAPGGTGAWAGHDDEIATWDGAGWFFVAPQTGWQVQVTTEAQVVTWNGSAWEIQAPVLQNLDTVGINTTADATNRLAVSAPASLFSHGGAGHQMKVNKSTETDTASLLFQTGWSGRAEMGTAGADDFAIKVSADGTAWNTGLELDAASGHATLPAGAEITGSLTGTAVQQSATDTTAGRLMRADYGFGPGNLLGTVSQAAGTPTGAVIERGSNANGEYVRFADGTQICAHSLTLGAISTSEGALYRSDNLSWTYPAAFVSGSLRAAGATGSIHCWTTMGYVGTTSISLIRGIAATTQAAGTIVSIFALGRWF